MSSSPAAATVRRPLSPSPSRLPAIETRGSRTRVGVTTSVLLRAKDRPMADSPKLSATRTWSGPMVYLPRWSIWILWLRSRLPPGSMDSSTNRGRVASESGVRSSASSSPVRSRDTLDSRTRASAVSPAGIRRGTSCRVQDSRYRARLVVRADSTGSSISSTPMRSRSASVKISPARVVRAPTVRNVLPRVGRAVTRRRIGAARGGQRRLDHDAAQPLLRELPSDKRLRGGQQPVSQHRHGQSLHVVGDHVVPAVQGGPGPAGPEQGPGGPGGRAQAQVLVRAGRVDQADHVLL